MKKIIKFLGISSLLIGLISPTVHASEDTETGGYSIEGVANKNQLDPDVRYFYLHEEVGAEDSVKVKLHNSSTEDKTLNIKIANANTNINGLIDYSGRLEDHSSLKTPLTSIATVTQEEVKVPKQSSVETEIKIKMPKEQKPGVVVGGIVVSEEIADNTSEEKIALNNTYSYTLGLVVTNENKVELYKNVSVNLENVEAILFDGKKVVQATILNPHPYIFSKATVKGEILEAKSKKLVKKAVKENVNIAPHSIYPFQFDWEKEDLKPGKYIFKGNVEANDQKWDLEQEFIISSEKANQINSESVYKIYIPNWLNYGVYGLLIVSFCGTIYLFIRRNKRKKG
ncbi:DUF916 and DUF3324 domain-containing protein [Staphylococcus aureus]|uniref:DUF916 and DUF3324 domain-containing protein n=1 Tax=Staphylococcus aureus TaxID=1280 RepID=UPI00403FF67F